ncbi:hypothetical protein [Streptosporangium saharense]|uniref:hypothetical protein n=1 Tax=Streptosporangium saharense TaxID=1706840 RepID=UPI003430B2AD
MTGARVRADTGAGYSGRRTVGPVQRGPVGGAVSRLAVAAVPGRRANPVVTVPGRALIR